MTKALLPMTADEMARAQAPAVELDEPGFGSLTTERGGLPLTAMTVATRIDGLIAQTDLMQTYQNVHAEPLEATYIFPLPDRAAVTRFRLEVAGRLIEGELKERGAARKEYDQAIKAGHRAAITEEERPCVFTMRVGNLPPGEEATVRLSLTGPLPYTEGEATYRFPLVVAPRYIPGTPLPGPSVGAGVVPDTDAVPDASRITPPVLLPGFPNPVQLSLSVEFAPSALAPTTLKSSLHAVVEEQNARVRKVTLQPGERLNRDFILRFRVAQEKVVTALSLQPDADGKEGTFALTLVPPAHGNSATKPRDIVFVLDRSGSMGGWKMVAARRAMARMVDTLTDADRFTVYAFDDSIETPKPFGGDQLLAATNRCRFQAVEFLSKIEARGGTEMAQPLTQAVSRLAQDVAAKDIKARDRILVLVTDGQVGNEDQILKQIGKQAKQVRIFTLGIDRAVNEAFLKRLADLGGGGYTLVASEERLDEVMDQVHRHIATPVLTGLRLEPAGLAFVPGSIVPARLPDLFTGTPLVLTGRYRGTAGALALQAREASGAMWSAKVAPDVGGNPAAASVWARGRLRDLEDRYAIDRSDELEKEIVATSLRFGVLCRFTAFVAVDRSALVNPGGQVHGIVQPVEAPEGWEIPGQRLYACAAPMTAASRSTPEALLHAMFGAASEANDGELELSDAGDVECVDSYLMDFGATKQTAPPATTHAPTRGGEDDVRINVSSITQRIQNTTSDWPARLDTLRAVIGELDQIFSAMLGQSQGASEMLELAEVIAKIRALLAEAQPDEAAVNELWTRTETALQSFLVFLGGPAPGQREEFWK
jgi:Ca-activated chloride channel family protein